MKLDLKTIVTLAMTIGLLAFTFLKIIGPEVFVATCGSVFAYYFNKDVSNKGAMDNVSNTKDDDVNKSNNSNK